MNPLRLVFVEPKGGGKIQDGVTVTPTKEEQTVEPDPGFDGFGAVTVEAIPDAYQDVTGVNAGAEDIRVGKVGIDAQGNLLNGEMLPRKPEQEKSVIPMKQAQTVSPDLGYALSAVNVSKIPDAYQDVSFVDAGAADIRVGKTGVSATGERLDGQMLPRKPEQSKSVTPTKSSQFIEPDAGYALSAVEVDAIPEEYANVSGVTAEADKVKSGYVFVNSEGVETQGTNTDDADTSDGTMSASQLEAGEVGYSQGQRIVGTKPIRTTDVEIDSLSPVPIPAGSYDGTASAKLSSAAAASVDPAVIKKDAVILGQIGTYEGVDTLKAVNENTLTEYEDLSATSVRNYLFYNNTALSTVSFPYATSIGDYAFHECTGLTEVDMPSAESVGDRAFNNCSNLTEVLLPSMIQMWSSALANCSKLTELDFPELTTMSGAFGACEKVSRVNVPKLLATKNWCFQGFKALVDVELPSTTDIGDNTFRDNKALETVILGAATIIRGTAMYNCPKLTTVVIRTNDICTLQGTSCFVSTPFASGGSGGKLYIKKSLYDHLGDGTSDDYLSATNWSVILAYPNNQILPIEGSPYEVTT